MSYVTAFFTVVNIVGLISSLKERDKVGAWISGIGCFGAVIYVSALLMH